MAKSTKKLTTESIFFLPPKPKDRFFKNMDNLTEKSYIWKGVRVQGQGVDIRGCHLVCFSRRGWGSKSAEY